MTFYVIYIFILFKSYEHFIQIYCLHTKRIVHVKIMCFHVNFSLTGFFLLTCGLLLYLCALIHCKNIMKVFLCVFSVSVKYFNKIFCFLLVKSRQEFVQFTARYTKKSVYSHQRYHPLYLSENRTFTKKTSSCLSSPKGEAEVYILACNATIQCTATFSPM